jgi:hypothetical protein
MLAAQDYGTRAMLPSDLEDFFPEAFEKAGWS